MTGLPTFDLELFRADAVPGIATETAAAAIDVALRDTGFLLVTGHGVDAEVRQRYFDAMREFFALPTAEKESIAIGKSDSHRGYVGMAGETLEGALAGGASAERVAGDLKEALDTGNEQGPDHADVIAGTPLQGANQWPDLPGFREAVEAYRTSVIGAAERMQRALAVALVGRSGRTGSSL